MKHTFSWTVVIGALALLGVVLALPTWAQASTDLASSEPAVTAMDRAGNVEYVGRTGGVTTAVAVHGNLAYVGEGQGLTILDVSAPGAPRVLGRTAPLPAVVQSVAIAGGYAYVAAGNHGLRLVDVSDPTHPIEVGFYPTPGHAWQLAVDGGYAYVADGDTGLRVLDVSSPAQPVEVGFYDTPGSATGLALAGSHAYIADWYSGLVVIDVSDPAHPTAVGLEDTPYTAADVAVVEGYAYIADGATGLGVMDVSDPAHPVELVYCNTPGNAWRVAVHSALLPGGLVGRYAYVADQMSGLTVVDVSDPAQPAVVALYDAPELVYGIAVAADLAYLADQWAGLRVVDVSDPTHPVEVGFYHVPYFADGITADSAFYPDGRTGGYVYVVDRYVGLGVVDVSDPSRPAVIGSYETPSAAADLPGQPVDVAVAGEYAYVVNGWYGGLRVVDLADPAHPVEVGFYDTPGDACDVAVAGRYTYVADRFGGLAVVDVADPARPVAVGGYFSPDDAIAVAVAGDLAYVAAESAGLRIVDVSNPAQPVEVGFYDTPGDARDVVVQSYLYRDGRAGTYAYIADGNRGLRVVDVSNPAQPAEVGYYQTPRFATDVAVAGEHAYVIEGYAGLQVVDVSDPRHPTAVGYYDLGNGANGVALARGHAYVANGPTGLQVVRFTAAGSTFSVAGRITDGQGQPLRGVAVSTGGASADSTDDSGEFRLTGLITGTYTITPHRPGFTFSPPWRTVAVPPDATGQDFIGQRQWLLLLYLGGDNDLADTLRPTLDVLRAASGAAPAVECLVLWDDDGLGDAALYHVADGRIAARTAPWLPAEADMGDPQTLVAFVQWARAQIPTLYTFLSIVDHGGGWSPAIQPGGGSGTFPSLEHYRLAGGTGLSWDLHTGSGDASYVSTAEVRAALAAITSSGAEPLDILFYDANLMAMIEQAHGLAPYVRYFVASENEVWASDAYRGYLGTIGGGALPAQLAAGVVGAYAASLSGTWAGQQPFTLSALDMSHMAAVSTTFGSLSSALYTGLGDPSQAEQIAAAYTASQKFDSDSDLVLETDRESTVDLYDLALNLAATVTDTAVVSAANALLSAWDGGLVLNEAHRSGAAWPSGDYWDLEGAHGLAVYLPLGAELTLVVDQGGGTTEEVSMRSLYGPDEAPNPTWRELIANLPAVRPDRPVAYLDGPRPGLLPVKTTFIYLPLCLRLVE